MPTMENGRPQRECPTTGIESVGVVEATLRARPALSSPQHSILPTFSQSRVCIPDGMVGPASRMAEARATAPAKQMRSASADGEDCLSAVWRSL